LVSQNFVALYPRSSLLLVFRSVGGCCGDSSSSSGCDGGGSVQLNGRRGGMNRYFGVIFVFVDFFKCYSQLIFWLVFLRVGAMSRQQPIIVVLRRPLVTVANHRRGGGGGRGQYLCARRRNVAVGVHGQPNGTCQLYIQINN
jgi:hypothetical protein